MRLTRRGFLAGGSGLMVAATAARAKGLSGKRVVVVGAGMAGISAARALQQRGADVTVIEARNRIGGRVWTSRLWADMPVDMGASWIHGVKGNPLTKLADAAGLRRVATGYDSAEAFAGGEVVDEPPEPWDLIEAAQDGADAGQSLRDAVMATSDWAELDGTERKALRLAVHRAVEHEYGGDWGDLSALQFDADEAFGGTDVLFPDGYSALADYAAAGLKVRTGLVVTGLRAVGQGVTVDLADGGSVTADHVVVTLPLGVLKAGGVRFAPALSDERIEAIDALGMGLLNKCWLRFGKAPPVPRADWFENLGATAPRWSEWVNGGPALGAPVLLGFNAAKTADEVEALDDRATLADALATLREMFGTSFPAPEAAQVTRWRADPLARGSYSYVAAGADEDSREALFGSDWDGRITFAGEATSADHAATVHGAWLSGLEAAGLVE